MSTECPTDPSGQAELEARLKEKEDLIVVLTQRLEQAAEQLDRMRRTGADRGQPSVPGIPTELVESQTQLLEDLKQAVGQWEELQLGHVLEQIQGQVAEIHDRVSSGQLAAVSAAPAESGGSVEPDPSQSGKDTSRWEAIKANLLAGTDEPESSSAGPVSGEDQSEPPTEIAQITESAISPVDPPEPVEFEDADPDRLVEAIEVRDAYIGFLIQKLRAADERTRVLPDWEALDNAPDDLRHCLEELVAELEDTLRRAEVESSLERAKLGREAARLRSLEEQLDKQAKRLGLANADEDDADEDEGKDDEEKPGRRRWLNFLGVSAK